MFVFVTNYAFQFRNYTIIMWQFRIQVKYPLVIEHNLCWYEDKVLLLMDHFFAEYDFRLVALTSKGKSCRDQRTPLLNVRKPGSKKVVLCTTHAAARSSLIAGIKSCEARSDGFKYYSSGYWSDVWDNVQTKSFLNLTLYHKSTHMKIQVSVVCILQQKLRNSTFVIESGGVLSW